MPQTELTTGVGFWKTTFLGKYTQKLLNGISSRINTLIADMGFQIRQINSLTWDSRNSTNTVSGALVNKLYNEINKSYIPTNIYGTSSTAAATAAKIVSIPSIKELNTGQIIIVKPTATSTVANMTINLNSFGAKSIRYQNAAITTSTDSIVWSANVPSMFVYDGTYWQFLGHGLDTDTNTTYSGMTQAEITGGTATANRLISPKLLRDNFYTESEVDNKFTGYSTLSDTDIANSTTTDKFVRGKTLRDNFYTEEEIESQNKILNIESQRRIFKEHNPEFEYFTIESLDDNNTITIELANDDDCIIQMNTILGTRTLEKFSNRWEELGLSRSTDVITLNTGDKVIFHGVRKMTDFSNLSFSTSGRFKVYGNILSLGNENVSSKIFVDDNSFNMNDKPGIFSMLFRTCRHLVDAENLILPNYVTEACYSGMFYGCELLTKAPKLPATTLDIECYSGMFWGCTSLVNAPELPAKILKIGCYQAMFEECYNLKYVKMLAINITPRNCDDFMYHMFNNVGTTDGIFIKDDSLILYNEYYINNCIPKWTTKNQDTYIEQYLTFEAIEPNTQIHFYYNNYSTTNPIEYSLDFGETWTISGNDSNNPPFPTLGMGQKILVRSTNDQYRLDRSDNRCFFYIVSGKVNVYGNIMSMIHGDDFINDNTLTAPYALSGLFYNGLSNKNNIVNISNLILSAPNLTLCCYYQMFTRCKILMPPKILARTLAESCCEGMFANCVQLLYAPTLYAKILPTACYAEMFINCSSLCYVKLEIEPNQNLDANQLTSWLSGVSQYGILIISDQTVANSIYNNGYIPSDWEIKVLANYNDENNNDYDQIVHGVLFKQFEDLENNILSNITNIQNSLLFSSL